MGEFGFDKIACEVFFPIYEVIASDIVKETGVHHGTVIDLGCGGGHLGLHLLKITDMKLILYDINTDALEIAEKRAEEWNVADRARTVLGDVQDMESITENSVNLAVSRGSVRFWMDTAKAFSEIYRILKPGGRTYIGCGFGNAELKKMIVEKMKNIEPEWPGCLEERSNGNKAEDYARIIGGLGFSCKIIDDERGMWIVVEKPLKAGADKEW